jgi:hypothetical protein
MFQNNNNNVATVLLLIALGALIWYLTNNSTCDEPDNEEEVKTKEVPSAVAFAPIKTKEPFGNQSYQPYQFAGASDTIDGVNDKVQPNSSLNMNSNIKSSLDENDTTKLTGVHEFVGQNGDAASYAGLDDAFAPPLPDGVNPDVVDINKNNVKNYDAKDFLPKEINSDWFDTDFSQAKHTLNDDKLINTERYVIGINTVGESLKNASYDIRGTVPNPKFTVSPWNNSTYEPDYNIKPLC